MGAAAWVNIGRCNTTTSQHRSPHRASAGDPSYSREHGALPDRGAKSSAGHAPVKCIGCISPSSLFLLLPLVTRTLVPLTTHTFLPCIRMPDYSPSPLEQLPLGYDFSSSSLSFSLSVCLSVTLFLATSSAVPPPSFSLSATAASVELFSSCGRASLLYRCYAPTTASAEPTGERVTSTFVPVCSRRVRISHPPFVAASKLQSLTGVYARALLARAAQLHARSGPHARIQSFTTWRG